MDAPGDAHSDAQSTAPEHPIAALLVVPISSFLLMISLVLTAHVMSIDSDGLLSASPYELTMYLYELV